MEKTTKKVKTPSPKKAQSEPAPEVTAEIINPTPCANALEERINKMEEVLNRMAEALSDKTASNMLNELNTKTRALNTAITSIKQQIGGIKTSNSNKFKSISETIESFNSRIQRIEHPKAEVIEIMPYNSEDSFVVPTPSKDGSIGDDLYIPKDVWVKHGRNIIPLNFRINLPRGIEGKVEPRSGFSAKGMLGKAMQYVSEKVLWIFRKPAVEVEFEGNFDADVINGKVDPGYRKSVGVIIKNNGMPFKLEAGTRIAQITYYKTAPHRYKKVDEFSNEAPYVSDRNGGFGSSGTGTEVQK